MSAAVEADLTELEWEVEFRRGLRRKVIRLPASPSEGAGEVLERAVAIVGVKWGRNLRRITNLSWGWSRKERGR